MRWTIGGVEVTRVFEQAPAVPFANLLRGTSLGGLDRHRSWLEPHFVTASGDAQLSIHAFVVRSEGLTIVVDTCVGDAKNLKIPGMGGLSTGFLDRFEATGTSRESVDVVLCTHLHFDHVGWNTMLVDGRWVPTFPRARYLFSRTEWDHWSGTEASSAQARLEPDLVLAESVRPVVEAGLMDAVDVDHRITGEVSLEPTPGHTPGHVSVRIDSQGASAVITGDCVHHPVQLAEPTWGASADLDFEGAVATRRAFVDRHGHGTLVLGSHFAPPCAGWIRSGEDGTWFEAAPHEGD